MKKGCYDVALHGTPKLADCFTQRLANELGVNVTAPNDIILAFSNGTYSIGHNKYSRTGEMISFKPERK